MVRQAGFTYEERLRCEQGSCLAGEPGPLRFDRVVPGVRVVENPGCPDRDDDASNATAAIAVKATGSGTSSPSPSASVSPSATATGSRSGSVAGISSGATTGGGLAAGHARSPAVKGAAQRQRSMRRSATSRTAFRQ